MTHAQFRAALAALGLTQRAFARLLEAHSGGATVPATTVNRWATGEHPVPPAVSLALDLMQRIQSADLRPEAAKRKSA